MEKRIRLIILRKIFSIYISIWESSAYISAHTYTHILSLKKIIELILPINLVIVND